MKNGFLYDWATARSSMRPTSSSSEGGLPRPKFFLVRVLIYFAVWIGVARFFTGQSLAQDDDQDKARTLKMQRAAGICIILFGLATTFAAFDFLMSLNAEWFSTMYGVYFFAGAFWSSLATLALPTMWLEKRGELKGVVTSEHYHDIGKLMFAFTFFWSYVAFSQFMLYWYADIPEETHWFNYRMWGDWNGFSMLLLVRALRHPDPRALSRHVKRNRSVLAAGRCTPGVPLRGPVLERDARARERLPAGTRPTPAFRSALMDLTAMIGVGGLFAFGFLKTLDGKPALAIGDPRLPESMAFQNI